MERKVYIDFCANDTVKINTLYVAQRTFDLKNLGSKLVIDLINIKVVQETYADEHPFIARVWSGDGTVSSPFTLSIEARNNEKHNKMIALITRGEQSLIEAYIP